MNDSSVNEAVIGKQRNKNIKPYPSFIPYLFILPNIALFFMFSILPIFYNIYISMTQWNIIGEKKFVKFQNYSDTLQSPLFWNSLWVTVILLITSVPFIMIFSLLFAVLLNRKFKGRTVVRSLLYLPSIISTVVVGAVWMWIFNSDYGIVNALLNALGLPGINWLQQTNSALIPVIVATIWLRTGYNMVIYIAGLQSIPETYYEAAVIDGANYFQQFKNITLPLLKSTNVFLIVVTIIFSFKSFDIVYVMTRGGPDNATTTIVTYIFKQAFEVGNMGPASAVSIILLVIIAFFTILQLKVTADREQGRRKTVG